MYISILFKISVLMIINKNNVYNAINNSYSQL